MKKYLEIQSDKDTRFWQIEQEGNQTTVRYGKVGNKGRTLCKEFDSEEEAKKALEKQVAGKVKQGYAEADGGDLAEADAERKAQADAKKAVENAGKAPKSEGQLLASFRDDYLAASSDISALCFSPDGDSLLCLGGGLSFWDVESGGLQRSCAAGYGRRLQFIDGSDEFSISGGDLRVFSKEGELLHTYTGSFEGRSSVFAGHATAERAYLAGGVQLRRWDRSSGEELEPIDLKLDKEEYGGSGLFSPDGKIFAYGRSSEAPLRLMDTETGESLGRIEIVANDSVLAFSPDGKSLAHFNSSEGLVLYDAASGKQKGQWQRWGEWRSYASGMRFFPDGSRVLLQLSGKLICWDLSQEEHELWVASDPYSGGAFAISPDGKSLAVARKRRIFFRDADTGALWDVRQAPTEPYVDLHIDAKSGHLFAFTEGNAESHVFDAKSLGFKKSFQGLKSFSYPGRRRFVVNMSTGLGLMDPDDLKLTPFHPISTSHLAMGPGLLAATVKEGWENKWLRIWDLWGRRLQTLDDDKKSCPDGPMCFSPDGTRLFTSRGKRFMVWDLETGQRTHDFKEGSHSNEHMAISPNGQRLATCDRYRNVRLWDISGGKFEVLHSQKAPSAVLRLAFSWDGERLFLGSAGEATTWDAETAKPLASISFKGGASSLALGEDGVLYVAGQDCSLRSYDAKALWPPRPEESYQEPSFVKLEEISPKASLLELEEIFRDARWDAFEPLRHTVLLRRLLQQVEQQHGIQRLHYDCTHQVLRHSRRLLHQFGHKTPPIDEGTSPCGRWLATGSWTGEIYEEGGELQIWERETGRCVNILNHIEGGVSWPDYPGCVDWSPDGTQLGVVYCTNVVGNFLPFSTANYPMTTVDVTNGGNRPPGMSWTADGRGFYVYCWRTCIAPLDRSHVSDSSVVWFEEENPPKYLEKRYGGAIDNGPDYGDTAEFTPAPTSPCSYLQHPSGMTLPHLSQSPLVVTGRDLGNRFPVNPAFPLRKGRKWYWAIAFESGLVICPEGAQDLLDDELSFSVANRFAWPVRWADDRDYVVTSSITEALEQPLMPLDEQDKKSFGRPKAPVAVELFQTLPIAEMPYYDDYRDGIQVEEYQLNTQEAHAYGAEVVFEGEALNAENLAPLVGKCVLYAESYAPERIKVGALLGVNESHLVLYYKAASGGSTSIGNTDYGSIVFLGEAVAAEAESPTVEVPDDFNPEEGIRAQFPCGKNLSQLSNPDDNATGELIIPLPFEGDSLTVQWEKIPDFDVDRDFAWEWGHRLLDERTGIHCLGRFFYNGEEMEPTPGESGGEERDAEFFLKQRYNAHGHGGEIDTEEFDGTYGFNVSLLMRMVPKKKGQFNAEAPVEEILAVRFGWKGSYQLHWISQGGSQWVLRVYDEKRFGDEDVVAEITESYYFDFFENTVRWEHRFTPRDNFDT